MHAKYLHQLKLLFYMITECKEIGSQSKYIKRYIYVFSGVGTMGFKFSTKVSTLPEKKALPPQFTDKTVVSCSTVK